MRGKEIGRERVRERERVKGERGREGESMREKQIEKQ